MWRSVLLLQKSVCNPRLSPPISNQVLAALCRLWVLGFLLGLGYHIHTKGRLIAINLDRDNCKGCAVRLQEVNFEDFDDTQMDEDDGNEALQQVDPEAFVPYGVRIREFFNRHPGAMKAGNHVSFT